MKISLTMFILKILTDLYLISQNIKRKNTFRDIIYNVLAVKVSGRT